MRASGSVFQLLDLAVEGADFVGGYEQIQIPFDSLDMVVTAVPHGRLAEPDPPIVLPTPARRNVLVTHGFVPGERAYHGEPGEEEIGEHLLEPKFDYIALGHYHVASQARGNAWYAGSTERMGWGDEPATPGYLMVELSGSGELAVEHVPVPCRPMETYAPGPHAIAGCDAGEIVSMALAWLDQLGEPEAMTRVVFDQIERPLKREVTSLLKQRAAGRVWSVDVTGDAAERPQVTLERTELPSLDLVSMFDAFVDQERAAGRYDQPFVDDFLRAGRQEIAAAARELEDELGGEAA